MKMNIPLRHAISMFMTGYAKAVLKIANGLVSLHSPLQTQSHLKCKPDRSSGNERPILNLPCQSCGSNQSEWLSQPLTFCPPCSNVFSVFLYHLDFFVRINRTIQQIFNEVVFVFLRRVFLVKLLAQPPF